MRITGRPKTSIYQHIRNLPLSEKRIQSFKKASGLRIREFAVARTGKSNRPFKTFTVWTPDTVLLVAHLSFDGDIVRGKCAYNNRSMILIQRVEKLMRLVYDFEPSRWLNKSTGVHRVSYYNVELDSFLKKKSKELFLGIQALSLELKREFLRAFFDDEGCMDYKPVGRKRRIRGYQKDNTILHLVHSLLADFGIRSRVVAPNEVVITGKSDLLKFQKEINFSPGVRINGNRSNSIWKEHLEKRDLLERAIQSFKS